MEITEFDDVHDCKSGFVRLATRSRQKINDECFRLGKPAEWLPRGKTLLIFYTTPEEDPRLAKIFGPDWYKTTTDA